MQMNGSPRMIRVATAISTGVLLICLALTTSEAKIWTVEADGGGEIPTIQSAIDAAQDGDSILVGAGTYTGDGNRDIELRGKGVCLIGVEGPMDTIIDCQAAEGDPHRGFHLHEQEGEDTTISGFTITHGYVEGKVPANYGGAILCMRSSPTIENCWLLENRSAHFGGGMVCYLGASPILNRVRFIDNSALNNGGGFGSKMRSSPVLTDVLFVRNAAKRGGAFWCWNAGAYLNQVTFYANEASVSTAGIWSSQASLKVRNCIIAFSTRGKAMACTNPPPQVKVKNCNLFGNEGGDQLPRCALNQGGNFSLDPLFTDPAQDDFSVKESSPCAPGNHPDGRDVGWIGVRGPSPEP